MAARSKSPGPPPPAVQAYLRLLQVRDRLQRHTLELLRRHGLTEPRYNVLRILRGAGEGGLPAREVARRLLTRVPDVTRLVDGLVRAGTVERRRSTTDRRVSRVCINARGRELLAALDQPVLDLHERQLAVFDEDELATLNHLLERLLDHVEGLQRDPTAYPPGDSS